MNNKSSGRNIIVIASVLMVAVICSLSIAQTRRPVPPPSPNIASYLPASDAIAIVDVKRMLNETMPSILGSDQAKLDQAGQEMETLKRQKMPRAA